MKTTIREVARKGDSVLVEYSEEGLTVRKVLSQRDIVNGKVENDILAQAAPYGVPIAELVAGWDLAGLPTKLEAACRDRGLWTKADFAKNPTEVKLALQQALMFDVTYLLNLVLASDD